MVRVVFLQMESTLELLKSGCRLEGQHAVLPVAAPPVVQGLQGNPGSRERQIGPVLVAFLPRVIDILVLRHDQENELPFICGAPVSAPFEPLCCRTSTDTSLIVNLPLPVIIKIYWTSQTVSIAAEIFIIFITTTAATFTRCD